jgi:hypothetical protein
LGISKNLVEQVQQEFSNNAETLDHNLFNKVTHDVEWSLNDKIVQFYQNLEQPEPVPDFHLQTDFSLSTLKKKNSFFSFSKPKNSPKSSSLLGSFFRRHSEPVLKISEKKENERKTSFFSNL